MHKIILFLILKKDTIQVSHIFREIASISDELWKPPKTHCDVKESTLTIISHNKVISCGNLHDF